MQHTVPSLLQPIPWSETALDPIADALAEFGIALIDDFLNAEEVDALLEAIAFHREEDNFKRAGIGNSHLYHVDKNIRGDYIKWIEPENALPASIHYLERMQNLIQGLNQTLFLSLKDFECHYAIYPVGSFFEAHVDQFKNTSSRKISVAAYLNTAWKAGDGGELGVYHQGLLHKVEPIAGRMALFRSDTILHEVLPTQIERYSITGWMLDRPVDLPLF